MGIETGDRFQIVHESVADFMEFPNVVELPPKHLRLFFQFLAEGSFVAVGGEKMVENLVVPNDPFGCRAVFVSEDFVDEAGAVFGFDAFLLPVPKREKNTRERERNGENEKEGEFLHA